jgi:hypothetical protein
MLKNWVSKKSAFPALKSSKQKSGPSACPQNPDGKGVIGKIRINKELAIWSRRITKFETYFFYPKFSMTDWEG